MRRPNRRITAVPMVGALVAGMAVGLVAGPGLVGSADAAPRPAAVDADAGTYVALPQPVRAVDTRTGANGNPQGVVRAGGGINPTLTGIGSVPDTGVGSVVVTITAIRPSATGAVIAYTSGAQRPATTTLRFAEGQLAATGTTVVPVGSRGRIGIHNSSRSGTVQLAVDVAGYYRSGTASTTEPGIFHPVTPRRFVDTRDGTGGVRKARVAAGRSIDAKLGSRGGLPATPGAAAVTVTAVSPSRAGTIVGGRPDEPQQGLGYANFAAGETVSAFVPMRLADGVARIVNKSSGTVDLVVDVVGYWTLGFAEKADTFQTRIQTRIPQVSVPAKTAVPVRLGGRGGVETTAAAAMVTLHALTPAGDGDLRVSQPGADTTGTPTALSLQRGRSTANVVPVPMKNGEVTVTNTSSEAVTVAVDIDGYVPSSDVAAPTGKATARYLDDLTGTLSDPDKIDDTDRMRKHGQFDGAQGYTFVLLDVGAQSVTTPILSDEHPGVAVAKTPERVAYTYGDLITLVSSYLEGYLSAPGHADQPTIAVGTNNDGEWDEKAPDYYAPDRRGEDWASTITAMGSANPDVDVRGANDIEPGFASTVQQALDWEAAYLRNQTVPAPQPLYFNGSADGCPVTWTAGTCAYGWTQQQLYDLASGPGVEAIPQIYVGSQATQWAQISAVNGGGLKIAGILSEYSLNNDFLPPVQAAAAIDRALVAVGSSPLPGFIADFRPT